MRALEINNRLSDCHTSLALLKFYFEWDWEAAERSLARALELQPTDSLAQQIYCLFLSSMRKHEEAVEVATRTCELEPLSAQSYFILGEVLYFARDYDKALEAFNNTLELDEMHGPAMMGAANVYSVQSLFDEAISKLQRAKMLYPENTTIVASLGATYAKAGNPDAARHALAELKAIAKQSYVSPFDFALIATGLGQRDKAIDFLRQAYAEASPRLVKCLLPEDPHFDVLRGDADYRELIGRLQSHDRRGAIQHQIVSGI